MLETLGGLVSIQIHGRCNSPTRLAKRKEKTPRVSSFRSLNTALNPLLEHPSRVFARREPYRFSSRDHREDTTVNALSTYHFANGISHEAMDFIAVVPKHFLDNGEENVFTAEGLDSLNQMFETVQQNLDGLPVSTLDRLKHAQKAVDIGTDETMDTERRVAA